MEIYLVGEELRAPCWKKMSTPSKLRNMLAAALLLRVAASGAQQPFDLDTSFATQIAEYGTNTSLNVTNALLLPSGELMISGNIRFLDDPWDYSLPLARLDQFGNRVVISGLVQGGGKLIQQGDHIYAGAGGAGGAVYRLFMDGTIDG
ncbi:MAG TPA: hypothetical protein PK760_09985, partial [Flavobacteriales bacterium]|nr:hypothetical protein [Flavobacteriales bacterium]